MEAGNELVFDLSDPGLWIPAYHGINNSRKRFKLLYGSRGRGGSTNVAQCIVARMLEEPVKGMMVRKVFEDIRGSQWATIKQWVEEHGLADVFEFPKAPLGVICKATGAELVARGMDNPGRAKSIPGLSLAWYEEADELKAEDFEQTSLSIRGENIEEWLTFNAPSVDHWLVARFFPGTIGEKGKFRPDLSFERSDGMFTGVPSRDPDAIIVHGCYRHNPFNKPEFNAALEKMRERAPEKYKTSGLGLLGHERTGMEFFPDFTTAHQRAIAYDPNKALHITFDFNTAPYMTLLVAQIHQLPLGKWQVAFLKEYTPEPPFSTPKHVCKMLVNDLLHGAFKGHKAGLKYYGDASGKNSKAGERETVTHDYETIATELQRWTDNYSDCVLRRNPPHNKARDFMAYCFTGQLPIEIVIHPDMHTTIADLSHLKQGPDGDILKEYDVKNNIQYEKWGHCSQAVYYLVIPAFRSTYDEMELLAG